MVPYVRFGEVGTLRGLRGAQMGAEVTRVASLSVA